MVGCGGLGSPAALYLAGAGIGHLLLADFDIVELSNLQRQIAHTTDRAGELKTHSAKAACHALNPDITITTIDYEMEPDELEQKIDSVSLVLGCSDNFPTRFAINAACVRTRTPLVSGACIRFDGQLMAVRPDVESSPCYRCLYSEVSGEADTCALTGVLGPMVGMVGCMQAIEAIKILADCGRTMEGRLMLLDGLTMEWNMITLPKNPDCPVCGNTKGS